MSSDNFWFVKGNKVYMGFASEHVELAQRVDAAAERLYKRRLAKHHAYHEAASHADACRWAEAEYSEYGIYWIDDESDAAGIEP